MPARYSARLTGSLVAVHHAIFEHGSGVRGHQAGGDIHFAFGYDCTPRIEVLLHRGGLAAGRYPVDAAEGPRSHRRP